eukprot:5554565-Alexandrium_andersonii.AAC.1
MGLLEIAPEPSREKPARGYINSKTGVNSTTSGGNPTGGSPVRARLGLGGPGELESSSVAGPAVRTTRQPLRSTCGGG